MLAFTCSCPSSARSARHLALVLLHLTARLVEAEGEASTTPTLRETVTALRQALESERLLRDELRRELERRARPWWRRLVAG
jgi:hypothetical protein